jgi:pSer/pThr/pTyr-binding forkhead associated (FHA) protein
MAFQPITGSTSSPGSGVFPILVFVQGNEQRMMNLDHTPFTVGRKVGKDLVVADPRVSRDHALITSEDGQFCVVDQGSKHGTFVNGERVQRKTLERNDRVEFGVRDVAYVVFHPRHATDNTAREFLSQISGIQLSTDSTDLEKLTLFLEAARKAEYGWRTRRNPNHSAGRDPEAHACRAQLRFHEGRGWKPAPGCGA